MQTTYTSAYTTVIKAPVPSVWNALTDPEKVKKYFFGSDQQCDWKVGSDIIWKGSYDGKTYEDKGKILAYEPMKRIIYSYLSNWSGLPDKPKITFG
ncbi:MAG: hypothetical protein HC819_13575 [Cyclobacteriaceae bacterium]|nr:hypothetical protein [Cyclobacteriaceae bacterium]